MQPPNFFCAECGAANPLEATLCFSCHHPLVPSSTNPPSNTPAQTAGPVEEEQSHYLQFTLSPNAPPKVQSSPLPPSPVIPLLHGRYEILETVGTGGFGAVYKARDFQHKKRFVAIKAIELDRLSPVQAIEATDTFNRELTLLSNLHHSHLPTLHEHFTDPTHWYLVMDFIEGEPLDEYFQQFQKSALPLHEVVDISLQLCNVLHYLHQLQPPVIFRDVKPANIMRTPGGHLYLIDFGIARRFKPGQTKDTTPLGSPGFAAPEQYGRAQTTPRSDIYGLGATLYFLLTAHDPALSPFQLPPIRSLCPTLPTTLVDLLTSMLAHDPAERPASISVVQQALLAHAPVAYRATASAFYIRAAQLHTPSSHNTPPPTPPSATTTHTPSARPGRGRWKILLRKALTALSTLIPPGACLFTSVPTPFPL